MHHPSAPCVDCGVDMDLNGLPYNARITTVLVSVIFFCGSFLGGWNLLQRHVPRFNTLSSALRADDASRVSSSLHSLIVVPAIMYGLFTADWNDEYHIVSSASFLQVCLLFSVGYFITDSIILLLYRTPQWQVFLLHHVIASTPYVIYLFVPACPVGLFILSCFLLVELTNIPLNMQVFLEQNGFSQSRLFPFALYTTLVLWVVVRIANPLFLLYVVHFFIWPTAKNRMCLLPGLACAWFIAFFCIYVFFFVLLKEVRNRWSSEPSPIEVADSKKNRALHVHPQLPLSEDEMQLTEQSPERIALYDAREKALEIERYMEQQVEMRFRGNPGATESLRAGPREDYSS